MQPLTSPSVERERPPTPRVSSGVPAHAEHGGPLLSIVVPVFNERDNVRPLIDELARVLEGIEWEAIFVDDDSPDGTAEAVRCLACERHRVRCIHRIGRRGLASACVEGMLCSSAPYLGVMDGDLQHDPAIIPEMLARLEHGDVELVVGSRYVGGGGVGDWSALRLALSRIATSLGRAVVPPGLKDPMSGFFLLRRSLLEEVMRNLSGFGFKILLDIVASARHVVRFSEVPFEFRMRRAGASKLDSLVAWEYAMLLADKLLGRYVPVRFLAFAAIGAAGVLVHLAVLTLAFRGIGLSFIASQTLAVLVSMVFNYSVNNVLTYRDRRRRGRAWLTGLLSFSVVCGVGALANIGVAAWLFNESTQWVVAAIAGVVIGAVWNYAVTSVYTWGGKRAA